MKRILALLILLVTLCSCAAADDNTAPDDVSKDEPFVQKPLSGVDKKFLLEKSDLYALSHEYGELTVKENGDEYIISATSDGLKITKNGDEYNEGSPEETLETLSPKLFEESTTLQLETNELDDGSGEAICYLYIDETVKNAFRDEELVDGEVFSVYYELDEKGRVVAITYSKAEGRENFDVLKMVSINYPKEQE